MKDVQDIGASPNLRSLARSEPGQVVLVLQGGGALGSYQAGVYQALHEAGIEPDWIIGTSIGAINASLIAGNAPQNRLSRLREFWKGMEQNPALELSRHLSWLQRKAVLLVDRDQWHSRFLPAQSAGPCWRQLSARRRSSRLLLDLAAGGDADRTRRFRSRRSCSRGLRSGRPMSAPARCAISTAAMADRRAPCHGVGRAASGLSGDTHRW